ncbi:thioester dehydrase [Campylobacter curvus]|uniref:ApeP family dehydratase n=1 Tax=Campylobacter curvus TaxID=200 RepID=UPI00147012EF|nr:thioester dehydrase [Campylobacter curvus]
MSLADYLPHGSAIVLIDEILEFKEGHIRTRTLIKQGNAFLENGKFAMHKAIEMMAQSLGVYDSKMRELRGEKAGFGFLLASRKFEMFRPFFEVGDEVVIDSVCSIQDESGFGVYDCELFVNGELGARAALNVMSPDEEFVERMLDE